MNWYLSFSQKNDSFTFKNSYSELGESLDHDFENELGINQDQLGSKGSSISLVSVKPLVSNRKKISIKGTMEEISEELSSHLVKEGILG